MVVPLSVYVVFHVDWILSQFHFPFEMRVVAGTVVEVGLLAPKLLESVDVTVLSLNVQVNPDGKPTEQVLAAELFAVMVHAREGLLANGASLISGCDVPVNTPGPNSVDAPMTDPDAPAPAPPHDAPTATPPAANNPPAAG